MPLSASPLSLKDQLAFYGAYHTNKVNVGIHIVCVPLIWTYVDCASTCTRLTRAQYSPGASPAGSGEHRQDGAAPAA